MSGSLELFSLSTSTPAASPLHGAALVRARAGADALFRRGIDLHAGFELEAQLEAGYRNGLIAELEAGVSLSAELAFQAASPLDLFDEAGLVMRLQAKLEAAAWVSASLGLDLDTFRALITNRLGPGPMTELVGVLIDESVVQAGVWARAAFAAEINGEASLTGSLLPGAQHGAGFSFALNYGAGFGYGTGVEFRANIGFDDPRRLMGRVADKITELTEVEARKLIVQLPERNRPFAEQGLIVLKPLLTMSTRTAFEIGVDLALTPADRARASATAAVLQSLADQAQKLLLEAAVEVAVARLRQLLGGHDVLYAFLAMQPKARERLGQRALAVKNGVGKLAETDFASAEWLDALADLADALEVLVTAGLFTGRLELYVRRSLGILGAAAALLARVTAEPPGAPDRRAPLATNAPAPAAAAGVVGRAMDAAPAALTLAKMASFLVERDVLTEAAARFPELSGVLDFLADALGVDSPGEVAREVLVLLDRRTDGSAATVLARIAPAVGRTVNRRVVPELIGPIKSRAPAEVDRFLDEVVVPTLVGLPAIVLPRVPELGSRQAQIRLREGVSALLLQSVSRFVLETSDVLAAHALDNGAGVLRDVAHEIEEFHEDQPAFANIAAMAARSWLPVRVLPEDAVALLRLAADTVDRFNERQREDLFVLIEAAIMLGLHDPDARAAAAMAIATTDDPVKPAELDQALARVGDGTLDLVRFVVPRALLLAGMHFVNEIKAIGIVLYEGAKAVVEAVEKAIELLRQGAQWLAQKVGELAAQVAQLAARIAGDVRALADRLRQLAAVVVERIRSYGWGLISPNIQWLPDFGRAAVRDLYNALFDALSWAIQAPLGVLSSIAGWLEQALTTQLQGAAVSGAATRDALRNRVLTSGAYNLHFDIRIDIPWVGKVDLGDVTIPAGNVLGIVSAVALDDGIVSNTINGCVNDAVALRNSEAQRATLQAQLDGQLSEIKAREQFGDLTPGQPLKITIENPIDRQAYGENLTARIRIDGANRSFVESPLGVPRRVSVRLNGHEYAYTPSQWEDLPGGIGISLALRAVPPATVPQQPKVFARLEDLSGTLVVREGDTARARIITDAAETTERSLRAGDRVVGRVERAVAAVSPQGPLAADGDPISRSLDREQFNVVAPHPQGTRAAAVLSEALKMEAPPQAVFTPGGPGAPPQGRPGLNVLQVAVSDAQSRTEHASVMFYMATSANPIGPDVVLEHIEFDAPGRPVPESERVTLRSNSSEPIDLTGWQIRDLTRNTFTFPAFTLQPGESVTVWTKSGEDDDANVYWNRDEPVRNIGTDALVLHDNQGQVVTRHVY